MEAQHFQEPFPHVIIENAFDQDLIAQANASWPERFDSAWLHYNTPLERKSTMNQWPEIPTPCRILLAKMLLVPAGFYLAQPKILADATLHGGGLHSMYDGDYLDLHLDADRHPMLGLERRANAILFVNTYWTPREMGQLELWDAERKNPQVKIAVKSGRLVIFETSDISYHRVAKLTLPPFYARKTLAVYYWGEPRGVSLRPRAQFVASANEPPDAEKEQLREARMKLVT